VTSQQINPPPATGAFVVTKNDIATPPAGPSGFGPNPVFTSVTMLTPAGTTCVVGTGAACDPVAGPGSTVFNAGGAQGYFTGTEKVVDQAGNSCFPTNGPGASRTVLYDVTPATVGSISEPSIIQPGNNPVAFSGDLHDNIDLGTLAATVQYAGGPAVGTAVSALQKNATVTLSDFGPPLVTDVTGTYIDPAFIRSIETSSGPLGTSPSGNVFRANQITFQVTDVAGNLTTRNEDISASVNAGGSFGSYTANNPALQNFTTSVTNGGTFCNGVGSCVNPTTANIRTTVTGPALTFAEPFSRVEWYYTNPTGVTVKIGEQAGAAGVGSDNTIINIRTWTWNQSWAVAGLAAGTYQVIALGVDSQGRALESNGVNVTISNT